LEGEGLQVVQFLHATPRRYFQYFRKSLIDSGIGTQAIIITYFVTRIESVATVFGLMGLASLEATTPADRMAF
jgi:hypothetical protein